MTAFEELDALLFAEEELPAGRISYC